MSLPNEIVDSGDSEDGDDTTPEPDAATLEQSSPQSVLSHRPRVVSEASEAPTEDFIQAKPGKASGAKNISIMLAAPRLGFDPKEYQPYQGDTTVDAILEEIEGPDDERWFRIEYEDGEEDEVSESLLKAVSFSPSEPESTSRGHLLLASQRIAMWQSSFLT